MGNQNGVYLTVNREGAYVVEGYHGFFARTGYLARSCVSIGTIQTRLTSFCDGIDHIFLGLLLLEKGG